MTKVKNNVNCFICKLKINIEKNNYCKISDYHKGKHYKSIYCHPDCWKEYMGNKAILKQALGQITTMAQKVNEIVEIR